MSTPQPPPSQPGRTRWRVWLAAGLLLPLLCLLLIFSLPYSLPRLLASQQIDLQFTGPAWHPNGFSAQQISLQYQGNHVLLEDFQLRWHWLAPRLQLVRAERVTARMQLPDTDNQTSNDSSPHSESSGALTALQPLPAWLPQQISINQLAAEIDSIGSFSGQLQLDFGPERLLRQPQQLLLQLELQQLADSLREQLADHAPTALTLSISMAEPDTEQPARPLHLQASLSGKLQASINARLDLHLQQLQAFISQASLQISLEQWQLGQLLAGHSHFIVSDASFALDLDELANSSMRLPMNGSIQALQHRLLYPQNWQLQGLVSGKLQELAFDLELTGDKGIRVDGKGRWQQQQLDASIELASTDLQQHNPLADSFTSWPDGVLASTGSYSARFDFHYAAQTASGQFHASTENLYANVLGKQLDNLTLRLSAAASLNLATEHDDWQLDFDNTGISFVLDGYQPDANTRLEQLAGALILHGRADPQTLDLHLSQRARVRSQKNRIYRDLVSQKISASLERLHLHGDYSQLQQLNFDIAMDASINSLSSKQLKPQNWNMRSELAGTANNWRNHTRLASQHGFELNNQLQGSSNNISLRSQLEQIDFSRGNPVEKTLRAWPELLSLQRGTIDNLLTLEYRPDRPLQLNFVSNSKDINGVYNSSELSAVNLEFDARINGEDLRAAIGRLSIHAINPGIPLNAISINGANYRASTSQPLSGTLEWQSIYAQLLNGHIYSGAHSIQLDRDNQVLVEVDSLELEELMRVYPTDGLEGNGAISGRIPLTVNLDGISIDQGRLAANQPGQLSFRSPQLNQMARSNPGLQILNQALEDFHFKVLTTDLSFEKNGKLTLAMRLEGSNPNFENGRPIHFNFNLEQNLFALLASIQLTNQVNDLILQPLQQRALNQ